MLFCIICLLLHKAARSRQSKPEQPSQTGGLEGRLCAQLWAEDREKQSFLSQIWKKKPLKKVLGAYFPRIVIVWGDLRAGAPSWGESSSLSPAEPGSEGTAHSCWPREPFPGTATCVSLKSQPQSRFHSLH